jgi:hypothetical protein
MTVTCGPGTSIVAWTSWDRVVEGDRWLCFILRLDPRVVSFTPFATRDLGEADRAAVRAWAAAAGRPWVDVRRVASGRTAGARVG